MKRKPLRNHVPVCNSIPPEERRAKFAEMIAELSSATMDSVGKIPEAEDPSPLPSLFDLVKSKFGLHIEHNAPEWAKRAGEMAFDSLTPRRRKRTASEPYNVGFDSGYMHGADELLASMPPHEQGMQLVAGIHGCSAILKGSWARQPSDKAADFFCGFRDGEKLMRSVPERARQMAQRTKIYRAIAARWKEIVPGVLHDTGQLHQWLLSQQVILPRTDSSEIRLVCTKIRLRYKKPGKPRKQKM